MTLSATDKDANRQPVLCVDLDGTLIKTDMLLESLVALIFQSPLHLPLVPFWLLKGKAHLKRRLSEVVKIPAENLPFNSEVLQFASQAKKSGRRVVLATASDEIIAESISNHLQIFDEVIASDGKTNRTGSRKLELLKSMFHAFDYAGNEVRDRKIWRESENSIIVAKSNSHARRIGGNINFERIFVNNKSVFKSVVKALRPHQWVKNLLLLIPLFLAHRWNDPVLISKSFFAFFSFCFCASAFYIFNDLSDLNSDRQHPTKKNRPFASGDLSLGFGMAMVPVLLGVSLLLALRVEGDFINILLCYAVLTSLYSTVLKKIAVLDVVILASFYSLRLFAGSVAVNIPMSQWLLAFSMFMFLSLAFAKRFSELHGMRERKQESAKGRGYIAGDLEQVAQLGSSSGYISAMVMALYVSSDEVTKLYSHPQILWLICPLLLYWVGRIWIIAHRGQLHEDPIIFALKDKPSYIVGALAVVITLLAI